MAFEFCELTMTLEIPFLSTLPCYLTEIAIVGNPIDPSFSYNDIRKPCGSMITCNEETGLNFYINSAKFRPFIHAKG